MADKFLTVVIRNPTKDEVEELLYHPKLSASSWSHAMDERDEAERRLRLFEESAEIGASY